MMAPTKIKERDQKTLPTDVLEKDEVELRLEKALFGDDAGFLKSLTREQPPEAGQLSRREDTDFEGFGAEDDQDELDDVADEDVCITGIERLTLSDSSNSCSSSTLAQDNFLPQSPKTSNVQSPSIILYVVSRHGTTATTTASPSHWRTTLDCVNCAIQKMTTWSVGESTYSGFVDNTNVFIQHPNG
jgi:hypothetical protein